MNVSLKNNDYIIVLCLLAFFAIFSALGWVGFVASDDELYADAARKWISQGLYLGDMHWHLRHTEVLPLALSFILFGESEFTQALPTILYFIGTILVTYVYITKLFGRVAAIISCGLLASLPLFAVQTSIAGIEFPELFFVVSSVFLFHYAKTQTSAKLAFIAGFIGGFAWLSRETSAGLLISIISIFAFFDRKSLKSYLIFGLGIAIVPVTELIIYAIASGDPLYRIRIDVHQGANKVHEGFAVQGRETGNIEVNKMLNPVLALIINQEFGLLFYAFIPAALWWKHHRKSATAAQRDFFVYLLVTFVAWFITISYFLQIRALPRYFSIDAYIAVVTIGIWLATLLKSNQKLAIAILSALIMTNVFCIYIENKDPLFGTRTLILAAREYGETIHTDLVTHRKGEFLARINSLSDKISESKVKTGQLYLYNPNRVLENIRPDGYAEQYEPISTWEKLKTYEPERMKLGQIIEWLKVDRLLPVNVVKRLNYTSEPTILYRVK